MKVVPFERKPDLNARIFNRSTDFEEKKEGLWTGKYRLSGFNRGLRALNLYNIGGEYNSLIDKFKDETVSHV